MLVSEGARPAFGPGSSGTLGDELREPSRLILLPLQPADGRAHFGAIRDDFGHFSTSVSGW